MLRDREMIGLKWLQFDQASRGLMRVSTEYVKLIKVWFDTSYQLEKKEGYEKMDIQVPIVSLLVVAASES